MKTKFNEVASSKFFRALVVILLPAVCFAQQVDSNDTEENGQAMRQYEQAMELALQKFQKEMQPYTQKYEQENKKLGEKYMKELNKYKTQEAQQKYYQEVVSMEAQKIMQRYQQTTRESMLKYEQAKRDAKLKYLQATQPSSVEYYSNGKVRQYTEEYEELGGYEEPYKGKKVTEYNENGILKKIFTYSSDGTLTSILEHNKSGKPKELQIYSNNIKIMVQEFNETGLFRNILRYEDDGTLITIQENYDDGYRVKKHSRYNSDGKLIKVQEFHENGKIKNTLHYDDNGKLSKDVFTDSRSGYKYKWVKIGTQTWITENLGGDDGLYDWDTAQKICPSGWRLPSNSDWQTLVSFAGGVKVAKNKLKAKNGWYKNNNGTDDYGFAALPSRFAWGHESEYGDGNGGWWSSTENNANEAYLWNVDVEYDNAHSIVPKTYLFSVRCVKNP